MTNAPPRQVGRSHDDRQDVVSSVRQHRTADYEHGFQRGFCAGWADRAEYNLRTKLDFDHGFELGYAAGVEAARRAMANAIAEVGAPHTATEVVRQLLKVWDRPEIGCIRTDSEPRPGDHNGGPVSPW